MNKKELKLITGSFSKPSKMPGYSYGLPAWECKTGSKLALIPGTVCFGCYAKRGFYSMYKGVKAAQYTRLKSITRPQWVRAMASQINSFKCKEFRWHDAGDIQSVKHLLKIFKVISFTFSHPASIKIAPMIASKASSKIEFFLSFDRFAVPLDNFM